MSDRRTTRLLPTAAVAAALMLAPGAAPAQGTSPDRPQGTRALCEQCHADLPEVLGGGVVHAPVAADECTSCHNPHTSRHGMLLTEPGRRLCEECHDRVAGAPDDLPHRALQDERECLACHDPHASDHAGLLLRDGGELCGECHPAVTAQAALAHPHAPAAMGMCSECHAPHAAKQGSLLEREAPQLCWDCHEKSAALQARHGGFELADVDCLSCHHPHGTERVALLRPAAHEPFSDGDCTMCHESTRDPRGLVAAETELCLTCHDGYSAGGESAHHPLGAQVTCTNCHSPHAGESPSMMRASLQTVCLDCHTALRTRIGQALSTHPAGGETGRCAACHLPHGAAGDPLLRAAVGKLCEGCHEDHARFAHPMGPNVPDPRDPDRTVTCLSCHDPHASEHRMMLTGAPERGLCIQCHDDSHGAVRGG